MKVPNSTHLVSATADISSTTPTPASTDKVVPLAELVKAKEVAPEPVREIGGRKDGPDPTRYGDWEKNGRCIDF